MKATLPRNRPSTFSFRRVIVKIVTAVTVVIPLSASATRGADWPQWRGPERSGVSEETGLLKEWPQDGPPLAWKSSGLGKGYSSVSVAAGRILTMGDRDGAEYLIAVSAKNGEKIWSTKIGKRWRDGGPRSTPTIDGNAVYCLSPHGDLVAVRARDGREVWRKDMEKDLGGHMMSGWGYSESPLVDDNKLICTPGGDEAALVALNKKTGRVIWKAAIPEAGGAAYASVVVAEVGGIRQYITLLGKSGGLVGVAAKDGRLLWRHNKVANGTANVPTPVVMGDLVFYSTGYGDGGSVLLRLVPDGKKIEAEEVYVKSARELQNHHGGVILVGDHLFGGHGHNNGFPFCVELQTGEDSWKRGRGPGTGSAAIVYADGHLYFRYENAVMALIEASPDGLKVKSTFKIPDGKKPSWSHPVIAGGRLYLRDADRLLCYDLKER